MNKSKISPMYSKERRRELVRKAIDDQKKSGWSGKSIWNPEIMKKKGYEEWLVKVGWNQIAIVPLPNYFRFPIYIHRNVGVSNDSFICRQGIWRTIKENNLEKPDSWDGDQNDKCPICQERTRILEENDSSELVKKNPYKSYPPRYPFWIVDYSTPELKAKGPQLFTGPKQIFDDLVSLAEDPDGGDPIYLDDPSDGPIIVFKRTGKGQQDTEYDGFKTKERKSFDMDWLERVMPFEDLLYYPSYDEVKDAFESSMSSDHQGESHEEEKEPAKGKKTYSARQKKEEEELLNEPQDAEPEGDESFGLPEDEKQESQDEDKPEIYTDDQLLAMDWKELLTYAKSIGCTITGAKVKRSDVIASIKEIVGEPVEEGEEFVEPEEQETLEQEEFGEEQLEPEPEEEVQPKKVQKPKVNTKAQEVIDRFHKKQKGNK